MLRQDATVTKEDKYWSTHPGLQNATQLRQGLHPDNAGKGADVLGDPLGFTGNPWLSWGAKRTRRPRVIPAWSRALY